MADQIQELKFQVGEAWKGTYDASTSYSLAAVVQDPTGLSVYRSLKSGNVGHPLSDARWWFKIIDLSSIKAESDRIATLNNTIAQDEAQREAAEQLRQQQEQTRINDENARAANEQNRINAEQSRVTKETQRETKEQQRIDAEQQRVNREAARVQAEQARIENETLRNNAEDQRAANEQNRISAEQQRINQEQNRVTAEQQRVTEFEQQMTTQQQAYETAEAQRQTTFEQNEQERDAVVDAKVADITNLQSDVTGLKDGSIQAGSAKEADVAGDLEAWEGSSAMVEDTFDAVVRTTAGDTSIETNEGGVLRSIVAETDFTASEFRATGFNLLRDAVAVGNGYFFLVPALPFGTFGTATKPNGLLFTNAQGENLQPTVYFKPLTEGEPTSTTDGVACPHTDSNGYRFYNPTAIGFIIVSGITLGQTCAHVAWSRRYDEYIAVNAATDAGSTISLTSLISAIQPVAQKMLICGTTADRIDWLVNGTATWQRNVGMTTPTWTTEADEVEEGATQTYTHSAVIVDMKDGGVAELYGATGITFSTNGTTISYQDTSSEATTAQVKYELSSPVTGTMSVANTFALEDWGLDKLRNVVGAAYISTEYKQGITDTYLAAAQQTSKLRYNAGQVSLGFGVCATVADDAAKVVAISDFLLLVNGLVTVVFTQGITATGATLNVSGTGAKPILVNGNPIEAGIIGPHTTAQLIYDGTAWNLVSMMAQILNPADLWVDMGLDSGVKWAKANIDLTQPNGFAKSPFQYECSFFSWGNIFGHNPTSNNAFDYDWGGINAAEPYYEGQVYGNTPGNTLVASFSADSGFDAARVNLGSPWRMPTSTEFSNLIANCIYIDANGNEIDTTQTNKLVTVNGTVGIYLQSKINGNRLFFPCSGYGSGRTRNYRAARGSYWSSTWNSARNARYLIFNSGGVAPTYSSNRYNGFTVRAVQ